METYDVIIVGLGCVGISSAYYCAKKGMKVLGIEQYSKPGSIGTSSFGETRLWRDTHGQKVRNDMMREAIGLWQELEKESGLQLMHKLPVLTMGTLKSTEFKMVVDQFPEDALMTPEQISKMYPGLKNIPEEYLGIVTEVGGIVKARLGLESCRKLAEEKYGATLIFNTKVGKVSKNSVETLDGKTYTGKSVVVCGGAFSEDLHHHDCTSKTQSDSCCSAFKNKTEKREIEYYAFEDNSGLPKGIIELDDQGREFYGMVEGETMEQYKMGEWGVRNLGLMIDYFKTRMPDKLDKVKYIHVCYITMIDTEEFQYKTDETGVHYAYGFSGTGFKFLPLHGKIVYEGLLKKINENYIPPRYRAKI